MKLLSARRIAPAGACPGVSPGELIDRQFLTCRAPVRGAGATTKEEPRACMAIPGRLVAPP